MVSYFYKNKFNCFFKFERKCSEEMKNIVHIFLLRTSLELKIVNQADLTITLIIFLDRSDLSSSSWRTVLRKSKRAAFYLIPHGNPIVIYSRISMGNQVKFPISQIGSLWRGFSYQGRLSQTRSPDTSSLPKSPPCRIHYKAKIF